MSINVGDGILYLKTDSAGVEKGLASLSKASTAMGKGLTVAGAGITASLGLAVKRAADFEQAIANAGSVTGKTGEELTIAKDKMEALAKTLGQTTVFSASQAADAFYDLSSRGFDVAAMSIEELQPLLDLAAATQSDLSFSTEAATATLKAFKLGNEELVRVADVFVKGIGSSAANMDRLKQAMVYAAPAAQSFGMSIEQTVAILGQLFDAGMEGSMAGTSLARMLSSLAIVSGPAEEALAALNLTLEDINPETHKLADTLALMKERGITTAQALEIFGERAGKAALALLDLQHEGNAATDTVNAMEKSLYQAGGSAKQVAEEQLNTLIGKITLFKSAVEAVVLPLGKALIPRLSELAQEAAKVAQRIAEWIDENEELTVKIVTIIGVAGLLMAVLGPMLIVLPGLVTAFGLLGAAVSTLSLPLAAVAAGVVALSAAWTTNFGGIQEKTETVVKRIRNLLGLVEDDLETTIPEAAEKGAAALATELDKMEGSVSDLGMSVDWSRTTFEQWAIDNGRNISTFELRVQAFSDYITTRFGPEFLGTVNTVAVAVETSFGVDMPEQIAVFAKEMQDMDAQFMKACNEDIPASLETANKAIEEFVETNVKQFNWFEKATASFYTGWVKFFSEDALSSSTIFSENLLKMRDEFGKYSYSIYSGLTQISKAWWSIWGVDSDSDIALYPILRNFWEGIKWVLYTSMNNILATLRATLKVLQGEWGEAWDIMAKRFREIWEDIKQVITDAASYLEKKLRSVINTMIELINLIPFVDIPIRYSEAVGNNNASAGASAYSPSSTRQANTQTASQTISQNITINGTGLSENALRRVVGSALLDLQRQDQMYLGALI